MENKKTNNKEVLTETQIISEFIGTLIMQYSRVSLLWLKHFMQIHN